MLTVKEFKNLGVEFIYGDSCKGVAYVNTIDKTCGKNFFLSVCEDCTVEEFSWRPLNTLPDNPKFKLEYNSGSIRVQWRPTLGQPKKSACDVDVHVIVAKPVFTQAMAEAGERVKVGMIFGTATGKYTALLVSGDKVVFNHESLGFIAESHAFVHPVDLRTPKQKAVDSVMTAICFDYRSAHTEMVQDILGDAYELGLIKC